ncbi:MAG: metalloendopeptidase-like rane protein [Acidimicrobiales bacterium]|nr:metalloendopeptidase-like rane protein [Acidimicrobiales bacterium]
MAGGLAVLVALGLVVPRAALAVAPDPLSSKVNRLQDQVDEASAAEAKLLGQIDESNARKAQLDTQVAVIDAQRANAQREFDAAQSQLTAIEAKQAEAEQQLTASRQQLEAARVVLQRRAVAAYTNGPPLEQVAGMVLNVHSMRELEASSGYVAAVVRAQADEVRRYKALKERVQRQRDDVDRTRMQAVAQRDAVVDKQNQLSAQRQAFDGLRSAVKGELARQANLFQQVQDRKVDFESQIAALQAQSDALAASLRSLQNGQGVAPTGHGVLAVPIPGAPITSGFGPRLHPIFGDMRMHTGVDFGATSGTPIHAAADGVVVSAGVLGGYGNATVIDHGKSLATLYGHQSLIIVRAGDKVQRGQVIGFVGCTGNCTGPHLHFEVRIAGTPVDPMPYL